MLKRILVTFAAIFGMFTLITLGEIALTNFRMKDFNDFTWVVLLLNLVLASIIVFVVQISCDIAEECGNSDEI